MFLATASFGAFAQGLDGIVVEKYYLTDAADAANATAEGAVSPLVEGSTVYRVYVDMAAGYKFSAIYGSTDHNLTVNSTTNFFNDPNYGVAVNPGTVSSTNIVKHTAMIDSWFTTGGVGAGRAGVLKSEDVDGSLGNVNSVLANDGGSCYGLPISAQDGFAAGSGTTYVEPNTLGVATALDAVGDVGGSSVTITDGTIAALGGVVGATGSNMVCIGQFTTDGVFTFSLNVQIINVGTGIAENYVSSSPVSGELTHPSLTYSSIGGVAPTVSMTSPSNGASVTIGTVMTLSASASASGSITSVEFFVDGASVGVDTSSPYTASYTAIPGVHSVYAIATDNNCLSTTSLNRTFTVPGPSNDIRALASLVQNASSYPACNNITGNLANATNSTEAVSVEPVGAGQDLWYRIVPTSGAIRVNATSASNDLVLELQTAAGSIVGAEENETGVGGNEILIADGLTVGATYYLAVRNFNTLAAGTFTLCVQNFAVPALNGPSTISNLCTTLSQSWTGATSYTATFNDGLVDYSYTSASTKKALSLFGLTYDQIYTLIFTSTFVVTDAGGNVETVVTTSNPITYTVGTPPSVAVRSSDVCSSNSRPLNTYIAAATTVCAITGYEWEFVKTDAGDLLAGSPIYALGNGTSRFMQLTNSKIPGIQPGDYYRVKIRTLFAGGVGEWPSTYQLVCITGTAPGGMTEENNEEVAWVNADAAAVVYPNPNTGDMFNLNVNGLSDGVWNVQVLDVQGRIVHTEQVVAENGINRTVTLNSTLSNGLYTVRLMNGDASLNVRMIVE